MFRNNLIFLILTTFLSLNVFADKNHSPDTVRLKAYSIQRYIKKQKNNEELSVRSKIELAVIEKDLKELRSREKLSNIILVSYFTGLVPLIQGSLVFDRALSKNYDEGYLSRSEYKSFEKVANDLYDVSFGYFWLGGLVTALTYLRMPDESELRNILNRVNKIDGINVISITDVTRPTS